MNLHPCLPQTMTPENLSEWIVKNAHENIPHETLIPLTDEEVAELEHKSSLASRKIDELKEVEKLFKEILKKGTPVEDISVDEDPSYEPKHVSVPITIPPTKGLDALNANRQYADSKLRDGHNKEITTYYRIPFIESNMMIGVDIEGNEAEEYSRKMTDFEKQKYALPILQQEEESDSFVD